MKLPTEKKNKRKSAAGMVAKIKTDNPLIKVMGFRLWTEISLI